MIKSDGIIRFIIGMVFIQGLLRYAGAPGLVVNAIIEISILLFFAGSVYQSFLTRKTLRLPAIIPFSIFSITVFLSVLYNHSNMYTSFLMYRQFMWPYLFFVALYNLNLSISSIGKINKFVIFFIFLQIPAAVYKYLMYGMREGTIIGTFGNSSGTMSTIFPLFIIGYLLALYIIYRRDHIYLLMIIGFIFFAWGGGKRAFFFILPGLILTAIFIYNIDYIKSLKMTRLISGIVLISILLVSIIYTGGRMSPTLNPENRVGGKFDLGYMVSYVIEYESRTRKDTHETRGRISTTRNIFNHFMDIEFNRKMLGDGPDRLYTLDASGDARQQYGFGYGMTGVVFSIIGVGLIGSVSLFFLYAGIGMRSKRLYKTISDPYYKAVAFGTILATLVYCFDFFMYSRAFMFMYMPSVLFFYIVAMLVKIESEYSMSGSYEPDDNDNSLTRVTLNAEGREFESPGDK